MKPTIAARHDFSVIRSEFTWVGLEDGTYGWMVKRVTERPDGTETEAEVVSGAVENPMDLLAVMAVVMA
jgi:hypothetical protein